MSAGHLWFAWIDVGTFRTNGPESGIMMKRIVLPAVAVALAALAAPAQQSQFLPRHLAVLRAGDGVLDLHLKQSPVFIDQFDGGAFNNSPSLTVKIPTNGPGAMFFNGHAATEGDLTLSSDRRLLAFAGYGGVNLLQTAGTPSLLDIDRAFCTVDAGGTAHTTTYKCQGGAEKMNPRGVVTDGTNNFWGCGNSYGSFYYNPTEGKAPVQFKAIASLRAIKIINHTLYAAMNGADGNACDLSAGIFSFEEGRGEAAPLPRADTATLKPAIEAAGTYRKNVGFDINPAETIAYMSDISAGVQKYVKTNGAWKFAYNFGIPQNISKADNNGTGCFGLAVDFSGAAPIVYATTTEGYGGCVNSNRVVRIVDSNATATVTTVAQAGANMVYRGIDFTPEAAPAKP